MKIEGPENIQTIFHVFHDGSIETYQLDGAALILEVRIDYLAERIDPTFTTFMVRLEQIENVWFSTWPRDQNSEPKILRDLSEIFDAELGIMEAKLKENQIQILCDQSLPKIDYSGGELYLTAASAEVSDEAGKTYLLEELIALADAYWNEFAKKGKS